MSKWITKRNCEVINVYESLRPFMSEYLFKIRIPNGYSIFSDYHEIQIQSSKFKEELKKILEGDIDRGYFAYGMQDIDIYRMNDGNLGITHSPHEGLNMQFILNKESINLLKSIFK